MNTPSPQECTHPAKVRLAVVRRVTRVAAIVSVLAVSLGGAGAQTATSPPPASSRQQAASLQATASTQPVVSPQTIEISRFAFTPREITVERGAPVTWVNHDQTVHSVIIKDGKSSSKGLDTDDQFSMIFDKTGDFDYVCSLHPFMTGIVHVREAAK